MKKSHIAVAAMAALAVVGTAQAQSSVTLFGNIDVGVRNVKNKGEDAITSLTKNSISSSALGFRGVEDLGGGLKAGFHLEGDLDPDTGTASGLQFQRRSTISLSGGFGEIRLGRDFVPTFTVHTKYDPFGTNGLGSSINVFGTVAGAVTSSAARANNGLAYFGTFGDFNINLQHNLRESASGSGDYSGLRVGYNAGPLSVDVATGSEVCQRDTASSPTATTGASLLNTCGLKNPRRSNIGASYDLGFVKPMVQYNTAKLDLAGTEVKTTNILIGLTAPVGPGTLRFSYVVTDLKVGTDLGDAKQIAVGYTYPLSKRTSISANVARISADDSFLSNTSGANSVLPDRLDIKERTGYELAVRHTF